MYPAHSARIHHSLFRGIEHVGVVVPDIRAAETFFTKVSGCEVLYRSAIPKGPDMAGSEFGDVNGMPNNNSLKAASMLRLGTGANIELFEVGSLTRDNLPSMTELGVTHFSIYCDDVKMVGEAMRCAGGSMLAGPSAMNGQEEGDGSYIWFGCTPWRSLIELIQLPTRPACDAPKAKHDRSRPSRLSEAKT